MGLTLEGLTSCQLFLTVLAINYTISANRYMRYPAWSVKRYEVVDVGLTLLGKSRPRSIPPDGEAGAPELLAMRRRPKGLPTRPDCIYRVCA